MPLAVKRSSKRSVQPAKQHTAGRLLLFSRRAGPDIVDRLRYSNTFHRPPGRELAHIARNPRVR